MARHCSRSFDEIVLVDNAGHEVHLFANYGAPTDGTSGTGAGVRPTGSMCIDSENGGYYGNTNTQASPVWTLLGSQTT